MLLSIQALRGLNGVDMYVDPLTGGTMDIRVNKMWKYGLSVDDRVWKVRWAA